VSDTAVSELLAECARGSSTWRSHWCNALLLFDEKLGQLLTPASVRAAAAPMSAVALVAPALQHRRGKLRLGAGFRGWAGCPCRPAYPGVQAPEGRKISQ
jgi:hypothetical protein